MSKIQVNTAKLRIYANRISAVNQRLSVLDRQLDRLYLRVGILHFGNLILADIRTGYSLRLANCSSFLDFAASEFDIAEKKISRHLSKLRPPKAPESQSPNIPGDKAPPKNPPNKPVDKAPGLPASDTPPKKPEDNKKPYGKPIYVSQTENNGGWDGYEQSMRQGCYVASTSMALSSLNITAEPRAICAINEAFSKKNSKGTPPESMWREVVAEAYGCKAIATAGRGSLDKYLQNYIEAPHKYSPPIINIKQNPDHYIVVTGKNQDGSYSVMDPGVKSRTSWPGNIYLTVQYIKVE